MTKNLGKDILKEAGSRESARIATKVKSFKGVTGSKAVRFVPSRLRWIVPYVRQYVKLPKFKFRLKFWEKEAVPEEELLLPEEEVVVPTFPQKLFNFYQETQLLPPLVPEDRLRGTQGTYQIEREIGYRGMGRLYRGVRIPDGEEVVIKEYLLPTTAFNPQEITTRKENFLRLAGVNLADNRLNDYRLITPREAIADQFQPRCYLITPAHLDTLPTLATYLATREAFSAREVHHLLNQVLQSLECLHSQKFRLPSGQVKTGIPHGNLNVHSLLIAPQFQSFLVYLGDLALWEERFYPPLAKVTANTPEGDLKDLGQVAYRCLKGQDAITTTQKFTPSSEKDWPPLPDDLRHFLLRLLGVGAVPFPNAEVARQHLLRIPADRGLEEVEFQDLVEEEKSRRRFPWRILWWLLGSLGIFMFLAFLFWLVFGRGREEVVAETAPPTCCLEEVTGIEAGDFTYLAEKNSTWDYVFTTANLIVSDRTLKQAMEEKQPQLNWLYVPQPSQPEIGEEMREKVRSGEADFAIASLLESLPRDLTSTTFAYDGLVIFVAFSYAERNDSLPRALNGEITFAQLRQLYTGEITNWQQLDSSLPDLAVKLYIPRQEEAVKIFTEEVLQDRAAIAKFRRLIKTPEEEGSPFSTTEGITSLQTFAMMQKVYADFENQLVGSIGFAPLSKVLGQCSVYPLALSEEGGRFVSPLVQSNGKPVTPETDLCGNKGSYEPNTEQIAEGDYPLSYPLAVIYPWDNSREPVGNTFAELLQTTEAQELLERTGLVPLPGAGLEE